MWKRFFFIHHLHPSQFYLFVFQGIKFCIVSVQVFRDEPTVFSLFCLSA